jgi:hypothetical protein
LDAGWLEQAEERILQPRGSPQFVKTVLGMIRSADLGLAELVQHYLSGAGAIDEHLFAAQLYRRQLVPLPLGRRLWPLSTNESRPTFYEGLSGVCYTARPVRLWSKVQLGFPPSPEKPQLPRIKLLAVRPEGSFDLRAQKIEEEI